MRTTSKVPLLALSLTFCLAIVAATFGTTFGQAVYGSVFGTVTDSSGAAVPNAKVTITEVSKNVSVTAQTNQDGNYTLTRLVPGVYRVRVEATGFKAGVLESVSVSVDTSSSANLQLQPGQVSEEVTITADAALLKTDRADVATTFEEKQVSQLPILDRNFTKFLLLTPGTQQLGWQHASSENPQGSVQIIVNGQPFHGTGFQLDGTDNRDPILGIIVINPTLESVTETKITSQNYDAEFGVATAGVATAQTKSGTNDYHGAAFLFRRNDETSARNPFSQSARNQTTNKFIPDTLWNQFGGAFGGRIIKDKLFFFGDYQGTRRKNGGSVLTTVPTALARTGNLSEYTSNGVRIPIFDPVNAAGAPVAPASRAEFAGGIIPTARLSQQALRLINQLPLPNRPGVELNYAASGIEVFDSDQWNTRQDWYLSNKFHVFGRYSFADFTRGGPGAFGDLLGGPAFDNIFFSGQSKVRNHSLAGGFDYTISDRLLADFRFGYFRYKVNVLPNGVGSSPAADAGIPGLNVDDLFTSGMPAFYINEANGNRQVRFGYALGVNQCNCPLDQNENQVQFVGNLSYLNGNHNFKFGADVRHARNLRVPSDSHRAGELRFERERTQGAGGNGGLGLASFLIGDVSSFVRYTSPSTDARERQNRQFFYGQDTWRATPKLTINYGLRWELIHPESVNAPGNGGFLDLDTGEIRVGGVGPIDLSGNNQMNYKHFAPRLGVAYQWKDKTVIRAGYGRSYDIGVFGSVFGHSVTQNLPVLAAQGLNPATSFDRVFTLASGPPAPVFPQPNQQTGRFPLPNGIFTRARPEQIKLPTLDAWNVTVQHQLSQSVSLEAAYVGNKGTNTFTGFGPAFSINQPRVEGFRAAGDPRGPGLSTNDRRPFFGRFGWSQDIDFFCNCASSNYHALQTKATRRFSNGFSLLGHYTWSKAFNYDGGYFPFDAKLNYGPTDTDRTHTFVVSSLYELPFGKGKKYLGGASRLGDLIIGGWQVNQITTISSGLPFSPSYDGCGADRDTGPCRPNLVGEVSTDGNQDRWFTTTGGQALGRAPGAPGSLAPFINPGQTVGPWQRPMPGTFGNAPRNSLRGPSYFNTDFSLIKSLNFRENFRGQFRAEVFNFFNNVNLGLPNGCVDCGSGGQITGIAAGSNMRQMQFSIRLEF
ncbi:MAG TPA: TonB-dependent receptor [Blastocatellia bacterium]|nr:TonB-dependent receptor [Blastocatellia bacterium]